MRPHELYLGGLIAQCCLSELNINIMQTSANNMYQIRKYFFRNIDKTKTLFNTRTISQPFCDDQICFKISQWSLSVSS